jgi:hypothetical protein
MLIPIQNLIKKTALVETLGRAGKGRSRSPSTVLPFLCRQLFSDFQGNLKPHRVN